MKGFDRKRSWSESVVCDIHAHVCTCMCKPEGNLIHHFTMTNTLVWLSCSLRLNIFLGICNIRIQVGWQPQYPGIFCLHLPKPEITSVSHHIVLPGFQGLNSDLNGLSPQSPKSALMVFPSYGWKHKSQGTEEKEEDQ